MTRKQKPTIQQQQFINDLVEHGKNQPEKPISESQNSSYNQLYGEDHPDFKANKEENKHYDYQSAKQRLSQGHSRAKETPQKYAVYDDVIRYWTPEEVAEGLRRGAIAKRELHGNTYWCITTEEYLEGRDSQGRPLKSPIKRRGVSQAYMELMEERKIRKLTARKNTLL